MSKLSEQEKAEIIRLLEAGVALPDKFRYRLFPPGKTEFMWPGKSICDEPDISPLQAKECHATGFHEDAEEWQNMLFCGDNSSLLQSLQSPQWQQKLAKYGGIKLIYIDPPFDVGTNFNNRLTVGEKQQHILQPIAYRDSWGKAENSFYSMIYRRLRLMYDVLADDGVIYVHCDRRVNSALRMMLDEIFGKENFINWIIWAYQGTGTPKKAFKHKHDDILLYKKGPDYFFDEQCAAQQMSTKSREKYTMCDEDGRYFKRYRHPDGSYHRQYYNPQKTIRMRDVWDISTIQSWNEKLGYATQKPESLLRRIINVSSRPGDIVADFFCGSGTTIAVAEKLGRKWLGADQSGWAVHTVRKRLQEMAQKQRLQPYVMTENSLSVALQKVSKQSPTSNFINTVLQAYEAQTLPIQHPFHGIKNDRLVWVVDDPELNGEQLETVLSIAKKHGVGKLDVLALSYGVDIGQDVLTKSQLQKLDLILRRIDKDIFVQQAVVKKEVLFADFQRPELHVHIEPYDAHQLAVQVELSSYGMVCSHRAVIPSSKRVFSKQLVVEDGHLIQQHHHRDGAITRQKMTEKWHDWIDYWAISVPNSNVQGAPFVMQWSSFRTRKRRQLELSSGTLLVPKGTSHLAVHIVDILKQETKWTIALTKRC